MDLVVDFQHGVAVGNAQLSIVENTRADDVVVEELRDLLQRTASDIGVGHTDIHGVGLCVRVFLLILLELRFLSVEVDATDVAHGDGGCDDAQHAQRVGAGVARCYLGHFAFGKYAVEGLVGGSKSRSVGHGSIERAHHHGEVVRVARVEEAVVAGEHDSNVEQDDQARHQVEFDTAFAEALKESRPHLQTNAEHEEDEAEILYEVEDFRGSGETDVPRQDAGKQHKGDSQRDASNFNLTQQHTNKDDYGEEQ